MERIPQFAAIDDGRLIGMAGAATSNDAAHVELISMWVRPEARSGGVGARLIEAVVAWAADAGFRQVRLWVVEGNTRAERLYERCGFTRTSGVAPVREGEPLMEFEMGMTIGAAPSV